VRSVVLNTLNRARFTVAVDSFIKTGRSTHKNMFGLFWVVLEITARLSIFNLFIGSLKLKEK